MIDAEKLRRAVEDGCYVGDVGTLAAILVAEIERLKGEVAHERDIVLGAERFVHVIIKHRHTDERGGEYVRWGPILAAWEDCTPTLREAIEKLVASWKAAGIWPTGSRAVGLREVGQVPGPATGGGTS